MSIELYMFWLPIALVVGLSSALLGPRRAVPIYILGAGYWFVLSLLLGSVGMPASAWAGIALGVISIALIGWWLAHPGAIGRERAVDAMRTQALEAGDANWMPPAEMIEQFDAWLVTHRNQPDPWPDFGEFVHQVLQRVCSAQHIRVYRVCRDAEGALQPLRQQDVDAPKALSPRSGLLGHVVTSGQTYYFDAGDEDELVGKLARAEHEPCAWCFAIRHQHRSIGAVRVGGLLAADTAQRALLELVEAVLNLCWQTLVETVEARQARQTDQVCGLLTRAAFIAEADHTLNACYARGEPVALVNIHVEGLAGFADDGHFDRIEALLAAVSGALQERMRAEDLAGTYDEGRFFLLLRRVDTELAMLIVEQLVDHLGTICSDTERWGAPIGVRAGVAGSGLQQPDLVTLQQRANQLTRTARAEGTPFVSDLLAAGASA